MSKYFYCRHCKRRIKRNVRIKEQFYCQDKACQQARKNAWERNKKRTDATYRQRRKDQHQVWLKKQRGDVYQKTYRERRIDYTQKNRKDQQIRNLLAREVSLGLEVEQIVKTDALTSARLIQCGLYEIRPLKIRGAKKIVKTDALFTLISVYQSVTGMLVSDCKDGHN